MAFPTCAVVVPLYTPLLNASERESLHEVFRVLNAKPKIFFGPVSFDFRGFVIENFGGGFSACSFRSFPDQFFESVKSYNKLLLTSEFYTAFSDYDYVLIYQLDAWVFSDDLDFWLRQGYDYVGAPWVSRFGEETILDGVGNGGFSLRRVEMMLRLLRSSRRYWVPVFNFSELWRMRFCPRRDNLSWTAFLVGLLRTLISVAVRSVGWHNTLDYYIRVNEHEDYVLSVLGARIFRRQMRIPPISIATRFAVETHAAQLLETYGVSVPFGCHALGTRDPQLLADIKDRK